MATPTFCLLACNANPDPSPNTDPELLPNPDQVGRELIALLRELELEHWATAAEEARFQAAPVTKRPL